MPFEPILVTCVFTTTIRDKIKVDVHKERTII